MKQAINAWYQHHYKDNGHTSLKTSFEVASLAPHNAEHGEEQARHTDSRPVCKHRQEARSYGNQKARHDIHLLLDVPQNKQIGKHVPNVGVLEAVSEVGDQTIVSQNPHTSMKKRTEETKYC